MSKQQKIVYLKISPTIHTLIDNLLAAPLIKGGLRGDQNHLIKGRSIFYLIRTTYLKVNYCHQQIHQNYLDLAEKAHLKVGVGKLNSTPVIILLYP